MKKLLLLLIIVLPVSLSAQSRSALAGILSGVSLDKLDKRYDDISGTTFYTQKHFTHYANTSKVSINIVKPKDEGYLAILEISYAAEDWLFFKKAYLSYDGNTKEIVFDEYINKETDIEDGGIFEWIAVEIDKSYIDFIEKLAKSPNAKLRLVGKYTKDRALSLDERKGLVDVIEAYKTLK